MRRRVAKHVLWGSLGLVFATTYLVGPHGAAAQDVKGFYQSKTVKMVIGYPAGSGYDVHARAVARHIGRHIPGGPTVISQNMPGAGSLKAANWAYNVAPKDGTILGAINRSLALQPLLETAPKKRALLKFDALKFNWLGSVSKVVSLGICTDKSGVKSFDQFFKRQVIATASGATSDSTVFPTVFNNMLGTKIKIIGGHQGSRSNYLALERGEADCYLGTSYSSVNTIQPKWLEPNNPEMDVVIQIGIEKRADLPHVPLILDYGNAKQKQALKLMLAPQIMGRPHFTTPGVPADRVAALRAAYVATMKDAEFLKEAKKTRVNVQPLSGEEIEKVLRELYKSDKDVVELLQKVMPRKR